VLVDRLNRALRSLRISVTDRCNLRCRYCMPDPGYVWVPRAQILHLEEIAALARVFVGLGVQKLHLTGGEPLLRQDLDLLVRMLVSLPGVRDLVLTTNGLLLAEQAHALRAAGLRRVTVSLDTLRPARFRTLTRRDELPHVLAGVEAARQAGLSPLKLNAVILRGFNDDELVDLLAYGRTAGAEVRFIEYLDVGGATQWSWPQVVSREEILLRLSAHYGPITRAAHIASASAQRFLLPDGTSFGIIPATTAPFCPWCERGRLTADGWWYGCLYARDGIDLGSALRSGVKPPELAALLAATWRQRNDRGAEARRQVEARGPVLPRKHLQADLHLEMHTRGG
jgi:cyclic pyranopterin phosphate synthase